MSKKVIILTGVSWSWKSSYVNRLKEEFNIKQPIQFTTRQPRNDRELDEYVFLDKPTFHKKLENWDFAEYVMYNGEWYAVSAHFDRLVNTIVIVEPVGAASLKKFLSLNSIPHISIYLEITPETMEYRLWMLRRENVKTIEARKKDFLYFSPEGYKYVVDSNGSFEEVYLHLTRILQSNGIS